MDPTLFLALAGLSQDTLDQLNQVGWFLPFLILVLPVSLVLFLAVSSPAYLVLFGLQAAAIYYGLRALMAHLRRSGFTSFQIKIMLGPLYLIACFVTNLLALLGMETDPLGVPDLGARLPSIRYWVHAHAVH